MLVLEGFILYDKECFTRTALKKRTIAETSSIWSPGVELCENPDPEVLVFRRQRLEEDSLFVLQQDGETILTAFAFVDGRNVDDRDDPSR